MRGRALMFYEELKCAGYFPYRERSVYLHAQYFMRITSERVQGLESMDAGTITVRFINRSYCPSYIGSFDFLIRILNRWSFRRPGTFRKSEFRIYPLNSLVIPRVGLAYHSYKRRLAKPRRFF